eukprot:PhM_4_TR16751/c0_g1_i1/m.26799
MSRLHVHVEAPRNLGERGATLSTTEEQFGVRTPRLHDCAHRLRCSSTATVHEQFDGNESWVMATGTRPELGSRYDAISSRSLRALGRNLAISEAKPPVVGGSTSSFPIDSHRKPREKALAGTGNPIEIIDDEAAHANVPFSREQILSLSRPVDRPAIEKWFTTLHAARLETLGGPPRHSLPETMAPLRTLPERLEHLREPLEKLARSAVKAKAAATTAQSWDCWQEGSMVTTTVVDTIVRVLAKHFPQHLILESLPFAVFANHGRGAGTLVNSTNVKNLIAVIAHIPGHFVLLTHRLGNSHVELLDSLSASTTASALSGALQFVSDRFAALLGTIDRNVTTV